MVSYKEIMKSAFVRKPIRSVMSTFSTFRHSPRASLPFKLKIESSAVCNLRCKMCPLHKGLKRSQGFLKFVNFKKVFDQIKPAYLNLTGIGEPFLNPEIFKIVRHAKMNRAIVKFDTNAMLLGKENIDKILKTKIDVISLSIDGTDKKSYESIRIGGNFESVKANVKNLVMERNLRKAKTEVHMFFVLQAKNIEKLPEFIKLADELGVDYVSGSFVVNLGSNKNKENKILDYKRSIDGIVSETRIAIRNAKARVGVKPLLDYLCSRDDKRFYNEESPCFMPWYSVFITWDGWVNPCDFSCDNEIVFGNAFRQPFKEIWNNEKIKRFRMQLLADRRSIKICRGCGVNEKYLEEEFKRITNIPFMKYIQHQNEPRIPSNVKTRDKEI